MNTRDTSTGAQFEARVTRRGRHIDGIDLTKHKLYAYLKSKNIDWRTLLSAKLLPDEAYLEDNILYIYEKKTQKVNGSADEKIQSCGFKVWEYEKIAKAIGASEVMFTYLLDDWFKQPKYKDMLDYINSIPHCWYEFEN